MKMKSISTLLIKGIVVSFIYAGSISPMLSLRFASVLEASAIPTPSTVLGLKVEVGDGVFAGIQSDAGDSRLFIDLGYGSFGMGTNTEGQPQFTVGGNYSVQDNFGVNLDYVINQLTADSNNGNNPFDDQLRVSLSVNF